MPTPIHKIALLIILFFCITEKQSAQDLIITTFGDTIQGSVIKRDSTLLHYQFSENNSVETRVIPTKYVSSVEKDPNPQKTISADKEDCLRVSLAVGYARATGKIDQTGYADLDRLSKKLLNGFTIDLEIQYYHPSRNVGIGLLFHYFHSWTEGDISIPLHPNYDAIFRYKEQWTKFFIGPSLALKKEYDNQKLMLTGLISPGVLLYRAPSKISYENIYTNKSTLSASKFAINGGIGLEYRITPKLSIGAKLSATLCFMKKFSIDGTKYHINNYRTISHLAAGIYFSYRDGKKYTSSY